MNTKKTERTKKWVIPSGLNKALKNFEAVCDVFFAEDEYNQKTSPIMICGPTGVGKSCFTDYFIERYCQNYHQKKPETLRFNCAAIPENLVESTLFGHEKGSFTGADEKKAGIFDDKEKLIILEEIGELPEFTQAKLLTLIEHGTFMAVGGTPEQEFNGQIIATTNRTQEDFRPDFFYRFFPFFIPAIHERRTDVLYYLHHFDNQILRYLTKENILALFSYHWPGNVREIKLFTRLLKINKIQFGEHIDIIDLLEDWPKDTFDKGERISFLDDGKQFFQIDPNYSKFNANKYLYFLKKLFEGCDTDRFASIQKIENLLDNSIGFSESDSPFPISRDVELIQDQKLNENSSKDKDTNKNIFCTVRSEDIEKLSVAFNLFCILFFRDHKANHDLLEFVNFTIPEIKLDFKKLKNIFTNFDIEALSGISLEILSLFSKEQNFDHGRKKLPLGYVERKNTIKKIYEQNRDNEFLSELMGIPKPSHNKTEAEIDIKNLTEKDIIKSYYGMLLHATGDVNKAVAKISGLGESATSQKIKKYKIKKEGYRYTLKAYKQSKS